MYRTSGYSRDKKELKFYTIGTMSLFLPLVNIFSQKCYPLESDQ